MKEPFTKEELQILGQALAVAQVQVGQAKQAMELLEKVVGLIEKPEKKV